MIGRGTRVSIARKLVNGALEAPEEAPEDIWAYQEGGPESIIIQEIRKAQQGNSRYFLTPVDYGFVPLDPATPLTQDYSQRRFRDTNYISKHARLHYRFVSREVGEVVHALRKFSQVFHAIREGWEGLQAIHLSRHVHRDVSSGNVLLMPSSSHHDRPERGVIMDLEYAEEIDHAVPPYGEKAGSVAFMATEAALMKHDRLTTLQASRVIPLKEVGKNPVTVSIPFPLFRHNPLHDVESIWWLCLWMLFYLVPSSQPRGKDQAKHFCEVFHQISVKRNVIIDSTAFKSHTKHLDYTSNALLEEINKWRDSLNMYYNISYQEQISSAGPLDILPEIIEASYKLGREHLNSLIEASKALPEL